MATWKASKYCQVLLTALWSDCSPAVPTTSGWLDSQPACREPGRPRTWVMPTCSKMQHFDIQWERPPCHGFRSSQESGAVMPCGCGCGGVHLLQVQRAFKRERSQRRENRDDAEASRRLTGSLAKVKLLSMQRFKCCKVKSFTGFTFLPNTLSKYKIAGKCGRL